MLTSELLTNCETKLKTESKQLFTSVSIDTRTLKEGALFVPLKAERNGHEFIEQAIKKKAAGALWDKNEPIPAHIPANFQLYFVDDTLAELQNMARNYRDVVNPIVIAITGSNGKTTTKDLVYSVLSLRADTYKTQGNYNNHIGLPLTILAMPASCQYLIVEMGMSEFGEIELLSNIAKPNEAIVTNIGESHMEQLGSREGIAKAKMEISAGLVDGGTVFIDGDEPLLTPFLTAETKKIGFNPSNHLVINELEAIQSGYSFKFDDHTYQLSLLGKHNVKNACFSIALATQLGFNKTEIQEGLNNIELTSMRLERLIGTKGETIINDAYNASPTSMIAAVETIKELPQYKKKVIVLGDMYELGEKEKELHEKVAQAINEPITNVILIGDKAKWIYEKWLKEEKKETIQLSYYQSKNEAVLELAELADKETVLLFKASRGMKLEQLIQDYQLERKEG